MSALVLRQTVKRTGRRTLYTDTVMNKHVGVVPCNPRYKSAAQLALVSKQMELTALRNEKEHKGTTEVT